MRFGQGFLDTLRDAVPLSAIVGQHVLWDKRKTNAAKRDYWACCPFHGEKTPSFHVDDRKGIYHCFGCGVSGDHFRFLVEQAHRSFPEAVEEVAKAAGIALPEETPEAREKARKRLSLLELNDAAMNWFGRQLLSSRPALDYALSRGLTREEIERFKIGFAPEGNALLHAQLGPVSDMVEAGLIGAVDGRNYDWFRGRLMFPVLDRNGHALGFSGRSLDGGDPKYLNTPATAAFDKGSVLYNGAAARTEALDGKQMVLVEGNIDAIATERAGYAGAAPMGTAMTETHLRMVAKFAEQPVFCFDGDAAGRKATLRAIEMALPMLSPSFTVRFAMLPTGQDPDTMVKRDPLSYRAVIDGAQSFADALWQSSTVGIAPGVPEQRAKLAAKLRASLERIEDRDTRRAYGEDFAERLERFGGRPKIYRSNSYSNHSTSPAAIRLINGLGRNGLPLKEAILVGAIAAAPSLALDLAEELTAARLSPEATRLVARLVSALMEAPESAIDQILEATGQAEAVEEALAKARAAGVEMQVGAESQTAIDALNAVRH